MTKEYIFYVIPCFNLKSLYLRAFLIEVNILDINISWLKTAKMYLKQLMKKIFAKILSLNLAVIFLAYPGIVLAQTSQNNLNLDSGSKIESKSGKLVNAAESSFSATKGNCFEFVALSLMYLPKELKNKIASQCKKDQKKGKIRYEQKGENTTKEVIKSDILAKTALVSDYIYQTPFDSIYREAEKKFGIPWQILSVIHEVESGRSGNTALTSYAGATGPMQFLPSTFAAYGVDGNGDGIASIYDVNDAIYSAANYLVANGGASGNLVGALYHYNADYWYVNLVIYKAQVLGLKA